MNRSAQEVKHIELPVFLCRRIEKVAQERNISFEDALTFLLSHFFGHKVLATSSICPGCGVGCVGCAPGREAWAYAWGGALGLAPLQGLRPRHPRKGPAVGA